MILSCNHLQFGYSGETLLSDVSFVLENHEKAALIGINGAGKTTLLKVLTGELTPEAGQVTCGKDVRIGYLPQQPDVSGDHTVYEEMREARRSLYELETELRAMERTIAAASGKELERQMNEYASRTQAFEAAGGYANESEILGVLKGLSFFEDDFDKPLSVLSGGERTRVYLGRLLLASPDLLLLDEPTNHLDLDAVSWLESYLASFPGAVLIVSHDRFFLDRLVTKVVEIENGRSLCFSGNYTAYGEKKATLRHAQLAAWKKQQAEIRHQEEVIAKLRSYNREKSIRRAESREKQLARMERVERPQEVRDDMRLLLAPQIESGRDVLKVEGLGMHFGGEPLFADLEFSLQRGEHVALIGKNGSGKSTILKILNGYLRPVSGGVHTGTGVQIGYYDQEQQLLSGDNSLFEEISSLRPDLGGTEIRNLLAAFLFTGDAVFAPIRTLSGGERGRLALAKLMLSKANFLILDEPTNHLDITSREILEEALAGYAGTVLCVSHDRYFINRIATRVLELKGGTLHSTLGNYDDYLAERAARTEETPSPAPEAVETASEGRASWLAAKQAAAEQRKKENNLRRLEEEIAETEETLHALDAELADPAVATDPVRCREVAEKRADLAARLDDLYIAWETAAEGAPPAV